MGPHTPARAYCVPVGEDWTMPGTDPTGRRVYGGGAQPSVWVPSQPCGHGAEEWGPSVDDGAAGSSSCVAGGEGE